MCEGMTREQLSDEYARFKRDTVREEPQITFDVFSDGKPHPLIQFVIKGQPMPGQLRVCVHPGMKRSDAASRLREIAEWIERDDPRGDVVCNMLPAQAFAELSNNGF